MLSVTLQLNLFAAQQSFGSWSQWKETTSQTHSPSPWWTNQISSNWRWIWCSDYWWWSYWSWVCPRLSHSGYVICGIVKLQLLSFPFKIVSVVSQLSFIHLFCWNQVLKQPLSNWTILLLARAVVLQNLSMVEFVTSKRLFSTWIMISIAWWRKLSMREPTCWSQPHIWPILFPSCCQYTRKFMPSTGKFTCCSCGLEVHDVRTVFCEVGWFVARTKEFFVSYCIDGGRFRTTGWASRCTIWWRAPKVWRAVIIFQRRTPWNFSPCCVETNCAELLFTMMVGLHVFSVELKLLLLIGHNFFFFERYGPFSLLEIVLTFTSF